MPGKVSSVDLRWTGDMEFMALTSTGHTLILDAGIDFGGRNRGPRPIELLVVGLAGCTAMDVISFLKKMRQDVVAYEVRLVGTRREEDPQIYTDITIEHVVTGTVDEDRLKKAIALSKDKYCTALAMMSPPADVKITYKIIKPE